MSRRRARQRSGSNNRGTTERGGGFRIAASILFATLASTVAAGGADVIDAQLSELDDGRIRVAATVRHDDTGWDHYADRFEVLDGDNRIIATRVLAHPHVDEQPFTRATQAFVAPERPAKLTLRAHDSRHGFGGRMIELDLSENRLDR